MLDVIRPVISHVLRGVLDAAQPNRLFAAGEQGVWYDPSDFSTLFQTSTGTTPVTAVGQPVGLILDKSKGLVLGSQLVASGAVGLIGSATAATYNTSTGAGTVTRVDASNQSFVQWSGLTSSSYRISVACTSGVAITIKSGGTAGANVLTLTPGQSVSLLASSTSGLITIVSGSGTSGFAVSSFRELPGNHAFQTTTGKRPVLEVDTNGRYYLKGDAATGRALVTNTITPGTDKVQVFAGVRKLSDAATAILLESSIDAGVNPGAVAVLAPSTSGANSYRFLSAGSSGLSVAGAGVFAAAPDVCVLTGIGDIANDVSRLKRNGKVVGTGISDQGTGNYQAYPLHLFARNQSSLYFDGRLYGLIVRFGPNLNAVTIMDIERYMAGKTGIMF